MWLMSVWMLVMIITMIIYLLRIFWRTNTKLGAVLLLCGPAQPEAEAGANYILSLFHNVVIMLGMGQENVNDMHIYL